ncbi:MAG: 16S rRNA (uracil(1498)-N(3))-methyltransferase [Ignavibacterium sp.]|jgi:16S rRNA (uracil1498-N3)-methyltransferase
MDFFLVRPDQIHGNVIILEGEEYKHLSRVLRKKAGDHVFVTDGKGTMYDVIIRSFSRSAAECTIVAAHERWNEPRIEVTIAVSLLRNPSRFDTMIEKTTELGVTTIIPLLCERTIPKHEKHARLERIAVSALKQCGRSILPTMFVLTKFDTLVRSADRFSLKLVAHEQTEQSQFLGSLLQHHKDARSVLLVVGPEGGLTPEEIELAAGNGFIPVSLGPRRLRSETAAISGVSWIVGGM